MIKKDKATIRAKREGYKARSVYKLFAINNKYRVIKQGDMVLDLGCWPGSWLQACLKFKADAVGIDLKETEIKNTETIKADVMKDRIFDKINGRFDAVISDMAPNTSGRQDVDNYKSAMLSERAFNISEKVLKEKGNLLVKTFQSGYSDEILNKIKKKFSFVKIYKPEASKKRSKEMYIVALGYKG